MLPMFGHFLHYEGVKSRPRIEILGSSLKHPRCRPFLIVVSQHGAFWPFFCTKVRAYWEDGNSKLAKKLEEGQCILGPNAISLSVSKKKS